MTVNLVDAAKMSDKPKKKFIKKAVAEGKGKLHDHLGVPRDQKIPEDKLRGAIHSGDATIRKEAVLAKTLKGMKHKNKSKPTSKKIEAMYGKKG